MGQVTLYLDQQAESVMKKASQSSGISQSKWVSRVICEKAGSEWPAEVIALAGAWSDFPTVEELRRSSVKDSKRESL